MNEKSDMSFQAKYKLFNVFSHWTASIDTHLNNIIFKCLKKVNIHHITLPAVDCGPINYNGTRNVTRVTPYTTTFPSEVDLECDTGFDIMEGSKTITCQANKTWSSATFCHSKCIYYECCHEYILSCI